MFYFSSGDRSSKASRFEERLLFYVFAASDADLVLSKGFDVTNNGFDEIGGIPFSESPNLTLGHGESGLLLCRVALGQSGTISKAEFLAGKSRALTNKSLESVIVSGSGNVPELYIVRSPEQILPYSIIRLKKSFAAKTILRYLEQDSGAAQSLNGTSVNPGFSASNGQMLLQHGQMNQGPIS